ncbi:hypothetical protein [Algibacter lectus]
MEFELKELKGSRAVILSTTDPLKSRSIRDIKNAIADTTLIK